MATQISFKNASQRNAVRVRYQDAETAVVEVKGEDGKPVKGADGKVQTRTVHKGWKPAQKADDFVPAGQSSGVYIETGSRRAILEEVPT